MTKLLRLVPRPVTRGIRNGWLAVLDARDRLLGRARPLTPPRRLHYVGAGDFHAIGQEMLGHFRRVCALKPHESVLDIGCGTGRIAVALLDYLDAGGEYVGFDISRRAVAWCTRHVTRRNPRFRFHFADVYNREYNRRGRVAADRYVFPCAEASVDFALATSVFTHMMPADVRHYLREIRRALRPGGRAFLTFFILTPESRAAAAASRSAFQFDAALEGCYTIDPHTPERALAYDEDQVRRLAAEAGLALRQPIYFGGWSGRASMLTGQDVVVVGRV